MATIVEVLADNGAIQNGYALLHVDKLGGWLTVKVDRHEMTTGVTLRPVLGMSVKIPLDIKEGDCITIEQLAEILKKNLEAALPACEIFVNQATNDFKEDF